MNTNSESYNNEETHQWIDGYFQKNLTPEEVERFEEKLQQDPDFREAVNNHKLLIEGIEEHSLKTLLDDFHEELDETHSAKKPLYARFAIAASLMVLIGVSAFFVIFDQSPNEKLFADNFKPDPGLPTTMSTTSNYVFFEGMVSYKRENYKEAIAQWEPLFAEDPANDTLTYFLGVAHLANKEILKAENYLTITEMQHQSIFYEEALYYLALAQIKSDKPKEAEKTLEKATLPKSRELLRELKTME